MVEKEIIYPFCRRIYNMGDHPHIKKGSYVWDAQTGILYPLGSYYDDKWDELKACRFQRTIKGKAFVFDYLDETP